MLTFLTVHVPFKADSFLDVIIIYEYFKMNTKIYV